MNDAIRRVGLAMLVLFVALAGQLTYLQVIRADDLESDPDNVRAVAKRLEVYDFIDDIRYGEEWVEKLYKLHKSGLKERQEEREKFEESEAKAKEGKDGDEKEDKVTKAYSKAIDAMTSRAYKDDVKIEASGDMVTVTVEYKAEKDETTAIEEFGQKQKEKFEAAAEFVDALAGGKAPSEAVLKKLGGSKLVEAVSKAKESLPKKDD